MKTKYHIDKEWNGYYGEAIHFDGTIEIDDTVISAVNDEWRSIFYSLKTPQEVVEHIAFNMIVNDLRLTQIDGFANLSDYMVQIVR